MDFKDKSKLERLKQTFSDNFDITKMYAWYLEHCPEVINADMIDELTSDGSINVQSAVVAILSEVFSLDADRGAYDRHLIRKYLSPSVRILDAKRYTENPYYKNIKIPEIRDGRWELKHECYPAFRGMICDDMIIRDDFIEVPPLGFFTEDFYFPAVLENGNEWMTLTPVDLDTSDMAIKHAFGKVVTFGLGLGYYAYMVSMKPSVDSITVVEKSEEVIALFKKHILPQFPYKDKVRIICADAFDYAQYEMPAEDYDVAFVDTWRDASDGAPMYRRMKNLEHLSPSTEFIYWIENFLISRCRAEKYRELIEALERGAGSDMSYSDFERAVRYPLD